MTSFERVKEYCDLESENLVKGEETTSKLGDDWPQEGRIVFENVSFSYSPNSTAILHDLTFQIEPREKVGIVGRTGAGKSSIFQAIYRMANQSNGSIRIDGVDIEKLSLRQLRSRLAIIPVIFSSSYITLFTCLFYLVIIFSKSQLCLLVLFVLIWTR